MRHPTCRPTCRPTCQFLLPRSSNYTSENEIGPCSHGFRQKAIRYQSRRYRLSIPKVHFTDTRHSAKVRVRVKVSENNGPLE